MKYYEDEHLIQLQDKVVNYALIAFSIFVATLHIYGFIIQAGTGIRTQFIINSLNLSVLYLVTIFRNKIPLKIKIVTLVVFQLIGLVTGLYSHGILSSAKIFIVVSPVFLSFIVSYRKSVFVLLLSLSIMLVFAILYNTEILPSPVEVKTFIDIHSIWIIDLVVIFLTSLGLLYVTIFFNTSLMDYSSRVKEQNKDLTDKEKKYRTLFEDAGDAITLLNSKGVFFDANQVACDYFKLKKEELIGKDPAEFSPEFQEDNQKSLIKANDILKTARSGHPQFFEWTHLDKNGNPFIVAISLKKIELSGEWYLQAIMRDITEQKRNEKELANYRRNLEMLVKERTEELENTNAELELINAELVNKSQIIEEQNQELKDAITHLKETQSQLVQAEKMASLGTLTSGVAHEINNPLNYLMGAYVCLEDYFNEHGSKNEEETNVLLNSIKVGIDRTSNIVKSLNQFSRSSESMDEDCDIHSVIDNCLIMMYNKTKHKADVNKNYFNENLLVTGNVGKLHQVIINIITNAIQAIPEKGYITVSTRKINNEVLIEINDTGTGIEPENITRIIEPFFTTKSPGEGTGLGLSITYSIIKEHKGSIDFESELNKGTKVKITLPAKEKQNGV